MPSGLELYLDSLRDTSAGLHNLGGAIGDARARNDQREEVDRKNRAEKLKNDRLREMGLAVEEINKAAEDPNFDQKAFAKASAPVMRGALETGEFGAIGALSPVQKIIDERADLARAEMTATGKNAQAQRTAEKGDRDEERSQREELRKIQAAYDNDDVTKNTTGIRQAYGKIEKSTEGEPDAAKDFSTIFNTFKVLDPGSTVREGEFKSAAEARSFFSRTTVENEDGSYSTKNGVPIPAFVAQAFQRANPDKKGAFLLPEQRESFRNLVEDIYESQLNNQKSVDERTLLQVDEVKGDRKKVLNRLAEEDLSELAKKRESRNKKKEAKAKDKELSVVDRAKETQGQGGKTVISPEYFNKIVAIPGNQQKFAERTTAYEARVGRPATEEEKDQIIVQYLDQVLNMTLGGK